MERWRQVFRKRHTFDNILEPDRKVAENLIERFKKNNPVLMELDPEVGINQITIDAEGNPCNLFILMVGHQFIFDYRLIPTQFEKIEVKSYLCDDMPNEFPIVNEDTQIEVYHSPDRYTLFVERNIDKIRKRLKSNNMTVNEALDALTGDFDQHIKWIDKLKKEKRMKHKEHIAFFNELLKKTENAYYESDVYEKNKQKNWGYSVTATSFEKNEKVIVGFNWGVDKKLYDQGKSHGVQNDYSLVSFSNLRDELGSFKRTFGFFYKYFDTLPKVQTNYCFFRSEKESQVSETDLELCSDLFNELIEYLEPSMLISFSKSLNNYLERTGKLIANKKDTLEINSGNRTFSVTKGIVKISNQEIAYVNLPHPNYPILGESRAKAWEFCFG